MNNLFLFFLFLIIIIYIFWRFKYFFRDPVRVIPSGDNLVSPADGTIVYVKEIRSGIIPIAVKKNNKIKLDEITKMNIPKDISYCIVGIFMHPTSVHINRSPIDGIVEDVVYTNGNNLPMTLMWWRVLLRRKPYEWYSEHIIKNSRNSVLIKGRIPVVVVQIADIYVSKIEFWMNKGSNIVKGDKIGRIVFGSQVDLIFPMLKCDVKVKVGQYVKAGQDVIADIIS